MEAADEIPIRSSGAVWTRDEDERLYRAVIKLTREFQGRSFSAVVTRIGLLWRFR